MECAMKGYPMNDILEEEKYSHKNCLNRDFENVWHKLWFYIVTQSAQCTFQSTVYNQVSFFSPG